jgi:hypothetical protein
LEEPPKGRRNRVDGEYRLAIGWAQGSNRWVSRYSRSDWTPFGRSTVLPRLVSSKIASPLLLSSLQVPRCARSAGQDHTPVRQVRFVSSRTWRFHVLEGEPARSSLCRGHRCAFNRSLGQTPSRFPSRTRNCAQRQ